MTEQEKKEIIDELEERLEAKYKGIISREDIATTLREPREKWFRDASRGGHNSLMAQAVGSSITSWAIWEKIRTITCYVCGKSYVRQLKDDDRADEAADKICALVYDLAMERRTEKEEEA